jgi:hypothetical protein
MAGGLRQFPQGVEQVDRIEATGVLDELPGRDFQLGRHGFRPMVRTTSQ